MLTNFSQKSLIILRLCNELLRRLSRAEDTGFCGQVFIYLFQSFPLGDKSSTNLRGEYHVDNKTIFEPKYPTKDEDQMVIEEDASLESKKTTEAVPTQGRHQGFGDIKTEGGKLDKDAAPDLGRLYPIFWSLQSIFSDPTTLFKADVLTNFKTSLDMTLQKFAEAQKIMDSKGQAKVNEDTRRGIKRKLADDDELFNPKYLTSPDLFELEVNDLTFRRHILVQALILIDFLLSLTAQAKMKLSDIPSQNKSVLYSYVLSPAEAEWAQKVKARLTAQLQNSPDGKFYHRMVDTILTRDKNWVRWKLASCPTFELPSLSADSFTSACEQAKYTVCKERKIRPDVMGAVSLSHLTSATDAAEVGLSKLRNPERTRIPTIESLSKDIEGEKLDLDFVAEDDHETRDLTQETILSLKWRALRLASKNRMGRFDALDEAQGLDPVLDKPEMLEAEMAD
jgi:THO complex subunit 1